MTLTTTAASAGSKSSSGTSWTTTTIPPTQSSTLLKANNIGTTLYKSPKTGLRGLCIQTGEPLCSLHVVIATESFTTDWSHKDDGLPHTLEHAIFLGSAKYPFKGILDKLANRSLADGTNAWTATDHTCYTLQTAGYEGCLNLLPIYADHILFPTLSEQSFVTEIHHITKEGNDKGVVYCEMQGRENKDGSLVNLALMNLLYPSASGYSSETGGKMKNLRTLANSQVQRYHKENYTPDNVMFVLSGNIDSAQDFLNALDEVELNILQQGITAIKKRPWISSVVPSMDLSSKGIMEPYGTTSSGESSTVKIEPLEIEFPSEDESRGTISIGWRGPVYEERKTWITLQLLWEYLTDSPTSPLQKTFVECDEPVCAGLYPAHEVFTEGYHQLWFLEVDVENLKGDMIINKLYDAIMKAKEELDMDRLQKVIKLSRRRLLEYAERRPTNSLIDGVIRNFLYGPRNSEKQEEEMKALQQDIDELVLIDDIVTNMCNQKEEWKQLIDDWILNQKFAVVTGKPSAALAKTMADSEKAREEQQAKDLGPTKLEELGQTLEKAIEFNEREIPGDVLTSVPIPSLEKVKPVPCLTVRGITNTSDAGKKNIDIVTNSGRGVSKEDIDTVLRELQQSDGELAATNDYYSYHIDWNHIDSSFITVAVGLSTSELTTRQRLFLPLLHEIAFKLPATLDDGTELTKDQFVSQLENDTVSYTARNGLLGPSIQQMISYRIQMENSSSDADGSSLASAFEWIRRVLYLTNYTMENVKIAVTRLLSEIPTQIRDGPTVGSSLLRELDYDSTTSNLVSSSVLRQWPFLEDLKKALDDDAEKAKVLEEIDDLRKVLIQPKNMQVFVAGNLKEVATSTGSASNTMEIILRSLQPPTIDDNTGDENKTTGKLITDISASTVLAKKTSNSERGSGGQGAICPLSAIESSFLYITTSGLGPYDPNNASLLVAIEYLTALEGDFWVKLRGAGLTYGSSISNMNESKLLRFSLYRCTDPVGAFKASSQILVDYASGKLEISDIGLSSAKSSLAYGIIAGTSTKLNAAMNSWVGNYCGKQVDYDQWMLSQIDKVSKENALHALITYLVPIFDAKSNLSVACPTNKADEICDYFKNRGWGANAKIIPENKLSAAFASSPGTDDKKEEGDEGEEKKKEKNLPDQVSGISMFMPGAFAAQFKCQCPKCG